MPEPSDQDFQELHSEMQARRVWYSTTTQNGDWTVVIFQPEDHYFIRQLQQDDAAAQGFSLKKTDVPFSIDVRIIHRDGTKWEGNMMVDAHHVTGQPRHDIRFDFSLVKSLIANQLLKQQPDYVRDVDKHEELLARWEQLKDIHDLDALDEVLPDLREVPLDRKVTEYLADLLKERRDDGVIELGVARKAGVKKRTPEKGL